MNNTLYTLKRQEPTTLSARTARAINWSRKFSNGALVLVIGLACLGLGAWTSTKADTEKQDDQQTGEHCDKATTEPSIRSKEVMEKRKIVAMATINSCIWSSMIHYFANSLLDASTKENRLDTIIATISGALSGIILGTIWGEDARRGEAKEKIGWRSLIGPATIFFGIMWTSLGGEYCITDKESTPAGILSLVYLGSLVVVGPFVMPHIIYAMRPPAKPAMADQSPSQPCKDE